MTRVLLIAFFCILLLGASVSYAEGCAASAYADSCKSCAFDASGKMNKECYGSKQNSVASCPSTKYPIASMKYAKGECPAVDHCISELQSCQAQYATGNDKLDCEEGSLAICFATADECVRNAAPECGEVTTTCLGVQGVLIFLLLGIGLIKFSKK